MKTVIFVRHAKSSWDSPDLPDYERPLNKRGRRDAPFMAGLFKERDINPDIVYSSPAVRALTTAYHFADELGIGRNRIVVDNLIYEYGPNGIIKLIEKIDNGIDTIMIFGHNPDLTHLTNFLGGVYLDNLPTTGIVCIDFDIDSWDMITESSGELRFIDFPKRHKKK